jgi:hypothetical protein
MRAIRRWWALTLLVFGCAGQQRACAGCNAENFGADWVVVQLRNDGTPFRCWTLRNTSIGNEQGSDGIWWQSSGGHLVHISNLYNRVQVQGGDWNGAYAELGLTSATCAAIAAQRTRVPITETP